MNELKETNTKITNILFVYFKFGERSVAYRNTLVVGMCHIKLCVWNVADIFNIISS